MSTKVYQLPVDKTGWQTGDQTGTAEFTWDYDNGRDKLINLYDKGKKKQWDANQRIDWSHDPDPENPLQVPDELVPIFGTPMWDKLTDDEKGNVRRNMVAWQFSQFLHGEQGALICTAKIVQTVPDIDSKYYAATQVMDEARHVETYSRYLDKIETAYPINANLKSLLDDVLSDSRWDMTYLGMQVLIEGLALAAFGLIRNTAGDPLGKAVNAYVMQDEARHVMFGRLALRDYYPQLTQAERDDREEFCADACYRMRDRFLAEELWERLGYDPEACIAFVSESESQKVFRSLLFTRIVPTLKDVGPVGTEDAPDLRRHGRDRLRDDRSGRSDGRGRADRRTDRRGPRSRSTRRWRWERRQGADAGAGPGRPGCQTCPCAHPVSRPTGRSRVAGPLATVVALTLLTAGCGSDGGTPVASGRPEPRRPPGPPGARRPRRDRARPAGHPGAVDPCGDLQCGSVTVPLDYARARRDPPCRSRWPATRPRSRPNGSGRWSSTRAGRAASGIDDLPNELSVLTPELLDRFDIVSFDPRGVGAQQPGHLHRRSTGPEAPGPPLDPVPTTPAAQQALLRNDREFAAAVREGQRGHPALCRHRRYRPRPRPDPGRAG